MQELQKVEYSSFLHKARSLFWNCNDNSQPGEKPLAQLESRRRETAALDRFANSTLYS
ncbi:hypothetical protein [Oscillatoria sp. FACHB-1406]|uniref:hypothetical protein n=1 Tax=Oscillatoria sp. FACHB-1406 TaxID=2692846 RepID=UPI0016836397|nr:hypothetical protein [Oscillatoria sp. FACHB-1406]MBD2578593.1 hypothetical protein [Oscillatoria sp. FACHB-1406]